jgi:hypothetical protein
MNFDGSLMRQRAVLAKLGHKVVVRSTHAFFVAYLVKDHQFSGTGCPM